MRSWLMVFMVALLAACSGGGSTKSTGGSGGGGGSSSPTLTLALSSSTVSAAAPATVSATVKDASGSPVASTVVTFVANPAVGLLSAPTALTNSSGVASVSLSPATGVSSGADTVTASATVAGTTVSASQGYQLTATNPQITSFTASNGATAAAPLSPYGQSVLTLDMSGVTAASPVSLSLTSACVAAGKATISPANTTNTTGTATFTYKDSGGCGGTLTTDTVTATVVGSSTSATTSVYLTSPTATSITFVDPGTQQTIYLKGSGYTETATVRFQVVDTAGNPLPGQPVSLTMNTFAGGLTLDGKDQTALPETQTSDASGYVSVIVNSGTVPTAVRVLATLSNGTSAQSNNLAVSTGLPTQTRFSLVPAKTNIEGLSLVASNTYTIYAADRSGNPVPNLTSINFWSEFGIIDAVKTTTNGQAVATFQSSTHPADGRVTVLAYALGEESFVDLNGNNVYDLGEPFQDLGDLYKDALFDNIYDAATDEYVSLSLAGGGAGTSACVDFSSTYPTFALDASIPNRAMTCDGVWSGKTYVRRAVETVLSSSYANPYWARKTQLDSSCVSTSIQASPTTLGGPVTLYSIAANPILYVGSGSSGVFQVLVADDNANRLNPMAAGSSVSAVPDDTSTIASMAVTGGSPVANSSQATYASITYKFAAGKTSGTATLFFTSPSGATTSVGVQLVATDPPTTCP